LKGRQLSKKRFILGLIIMVVLACPIAAALLMLEGVPARSAATETLPASPTLVIFPSDVPGIVATGTPAAIEPIFATHAAIETQFAATSIALTPSP
jgi:hypothetical protein